MPLVRRTRATLRSAEFGFLGVVVYTRVHTPRRWGLPLSAGVLVLPTLSSRPLRTSCWIVGTASPSSVCGAGSGAAAGPALVVLASGAGARPAAPRARACRTLPSGPGPCGTHRGGPALVEPAGSPSRRPLAR